jgi:hypothetical protein
LENRRTWRRGIEEERRGKIFVRRGLRGEAVRSDIETDLRERERERRDETRLERTFVVIPWGTVLTRRGRDLRRAFSGDLAWKRRRSQTERDSLFMLCGRERERDEMRSWLGLAWLDERLVKGRQFDSIRFLPFNSTKQEKCLPIFLFVGEESGIECNNVRSLNESDEYIDTG